MSNDRQEEQALLHQLQSNGNPAAPQEAAQLQGLYHDRQMGDLATDGYDAASKNRGSSSAPGDRRIAHA